jgi:hypothetical protein
LNKYISENICDEYVIFSKIDDSFQIILDGNIRNFIIYLSSLDKNHYGRSNFNIHGGDAPGSAGCIDIGHNDIDFFNDIRRDFNNPVPVRVDYSGKSSESCDQNCPNRKTNPWPKK